MSKTIERPPAKLSIVEIVALIVIACATFAWGYIARSFSMTKYWVVTGMFLPYIYIVLLVGYLGKRGIRISKEFIIAVMFCLMLFTAKWYYFSGSSEVNYYNELANTYSASLTAWNYPEGVRDYLAGLVPTWIIPQDETATRYYYEGGGTPNWQVFAGPAIFWSLQLISVTLVSAPMLFLILGPYWWEVERMQWPIAIPSMFVINETWPQVGAEEKGEWGRLTNFKIPRNKTFWIAFIIGLVLNTPYVLTQVFPMIPASYGAGGGYGTYPINIVYEEVLPNAQLSNSLVLYNALICSIMPLDISMTILIVRIWTGFIYRPLVTRMGIVPAGVNPAQAWPWPHQTFARLGGGIGMALIALWMTRKTWLRAFKTLGGEDFKVGGISARMGTITMVIGAVLMIGLWTAAGGNLLITILWFIILTLLNIGGAYYYAGAMWYGAHCTGYQAWQLTFPVGVGLGIWGATPPQQNQALAIHGLMWGTSGTCTGYYEGNSVLSQTTISATYGLARGTNTDMRKVFIYIIIATIFLVPFSIVMNSYVNCNVGIANTGESGMEVFPRNAIGPGMDTGVRALTWGLGALSFTDVWLWTIIGSAVFILIGWARTVFPWFFLHPLGVFIGIEDGWWVGWINPLIGITLRVVLERALGPKRAMEYLVPILAGLVVGLGALYIWVALHLTFTVSMPNLFALWR